MSICRPGILMRKSVLVISVKLKQFITLALKTFIQHTDKGASTFWEEHDGLTAWRFSIFIFLDLLLLKSPQGHTISGIMLCSKGDLL